MTGNNADENEQLCTTMKKVTAKSNGAEKVETHFAGRYIKDGPATIKTFRLCLPYVERYSP